MNYDNFMPLAVPDHLLSVEEYLEFEQKASVRHEYIAGTLYALAGVTKRYSLIVGNIRGQLWLASRGTSCRVYEDVKMRPADNLFYYPDVMVAYHEEEGDALFETAPCLLVEVLSESTAHVDKCEKLTACQQIKTLKTYLTVHQNEKRLEHHRLDAEGCWQHAHVTDGGRVPLACPDIVLNMNDIYEGVNI